MRQTSKAVLMLLGAASATQTDSGFATALKTATA